MFVILVYDVEQKRVAKVLKKCRKYLYWIQNSVLEGELTEMSLRQLKRVKTIIDEERDSVIIYKFQSTKYSSGKSLVVKKG